MNLLPGQKVFIFADFQEKRNYTKIRRDIISEIYTNNAGIQMLEFAYLPCDLPVSEIGKTIFIDENEAEERFKSQLLEEKLEPIISTRYKLVYPLCVPSLGIGIIKFIDDGNYCINEYFVGNKKNRSKNKIYTNKSGKKYIKKKGTIFYLDSFRKTVPFA